MPIARCLHIQTRIQYCAERARGHALCCLLLPCSSQQQAVLWPAGGPCRPCLSSTMSAAAAAGHDTCLSHSHTQSSRYIHTAQSNSPQLYMLRPPQRLPAASGSGDLWLSIGFGKDTTQNVRLRIDEATGGVLLTGYTVGANGALTKACGAMYSVSVGEGEWHAAALPAPLMPHRPAHGSAASAPSWCRICRALARCRGCSAMCQHAVLADMLHLPNDLLLQVTEDNGLAELLYEDLTGTTKA